jgi:5-methylcytosine-specific restriction endonuclease McrA
MVQSRDIVPWDGVRGILAVVRPCVRRRYPAGWDELALAMKNAAGWVCALCGRQVRGNKLGVHHIDGNRLNCDPANLMVVCWDCHRVIHLRGGAIIPLSRRRSGL